MEKINLLILTILLFTFSLVVVSDARIVRSAGNDMDYYKSLRNILSKYMAFDKSKDFMREFVFSLRIYNKNSPKIQKVCEKVRGAILKLEDPRVDLPFVTYFINTILPEFQKELYNFSNPEVYSEVLKTIIDSVLNFVKSGDVSGAPENLYKNIIKNAANRDDKIGAFFAQLFNRLYIQSSDFEEIEGDLQRFILSDNYSVHTKHQILTKAFKEMLAVPDDVNLGNFRLELLISGITQNNLYIKSFSVCSLAKLCCKEGFSKDVRIFAFESALMGVKSIPWDIYFDRNGKVPEEVSYIAVCIDYLADAEEACRELYDLDVDLAEDEEFVQIYKLLLLRGFDLESHRKFMNEN